MQDGEMIGPYRVGRLVAVQGAENCTSPMCRRYYTRGENGEIIPCPCIGYHCPVCGEPCSMIGHSACTGEQSRDCRSDIDVIREMPTVRGLCSICFSWFLGPDEKQRERDTPMLVSPSANRRHCGLAA